MTTQDKVCLEQIDYYIALMTKEEYKVTMRTAVQEVRDKIASPLEEYGPRAREFRIVKEALREGFQKGEISEREACKAIAENQAQSPCGSANCDCYYCEGYKKACAEIAEKIDARSITPGTSTR